MNPRTTRNLTQWIKKQIYVSRRQGACTKLVLHHVGTSGKLGPQIVTVNVGENKEPGAKVEDQDVEQYAAELGEEAANYAEGIGQTQTFAVAAYFEEDEHTPVSRHAFTVRVDKEESGEDVSSEPADAHGLLKQLMRHNEANTRMLVASFGSVLNTMQRNNEQQSKMIENMLNDRVEQVEAVEALISAKHQRELEVKREELSAAHQAQVMDNVLALLPAVANKIVGKKLLPEKTDIVKMQLVKLTEALTPAEVEKLIESMESPEKKIAMIELLKTIGESVGTTGDEKPSNGKATAQS